MTDPNEFDAFYMIGWVAHLGFVGAWIWTAVMTESFKLSGRRLRIVIGLLVASVLLPLARGWLTPALLGLDRKTFEFGLSGLALASIVMLIVSYVLSWMSGDKPEGDANR